MLADPRAALTRAYPLLAALLIAGGLALRWSCVHTGFMVDDYLQLAIIERVYPVDRSPLQLFTFATGAPAQNAVLRAHGLLAWWSQPDLRISMFRPLSCALMWLDHALFGLNALAYHLHGAAWWLAMGAALAALLRRVLPPGVALLALLLFVVDDAHTALLNWVAMRNASVASAFALLGLWAQVRARQDGWAPGRKLALGCYVLALAAGEYALAFAGYALLCELQEPLPRAARVRRLIPAAVVLGLYFTVRALFGAGASGSAMYLDPLSDPIEFVRMGSLRLLVLVADLLTGLPAAFWTWGVPWSPEDIRGSPLAVLQPDLHQLRVLHAWFGLACAIIALFVGRTAVRAARRHAPSGAGWLVLGIPLAIVPVLGSFPESRLLVPALVGFCAVPPLLLLARVDDARSGGMRAWLAAALAAGFVAYHLALPVSRARVDADLPRRIAGAVRRSILDPALDPLVRPGKRVLLFSASEATTTIYGGLVRRVHGRPAPAEWQLLSSTFTQQRIDRLTDRSFALERVHSGFSALDTYAEFFTQRPLRVGDHFRAGGLRVTIERVERGLPMRTRYELDVPLEHPSLVFLVQTVRGLEPFPLPPVGGSWAVLPPQPPFEHR